MVEQRGGCHTCQQVFHDLASFHNGFDQIFLLNNVQAVRKMVSLQRGHAIKHNVFKMK